MMRHTLRASGFGTLLLAVALTASGARAADRPFDVAVASADPPATNPLCENGSAIDADRAVLARRHQNRIVFDGKLPENPSATPFTPTRDSVQVLVAVHDSAAPLLDLTGAAAVPAGEPSTGCGPRDGWHQRGKTWAYRNLTDALPPACTPASSHGLRSLRLHRLPGDKERYALHLTARPATLPAVTGSLDTTVMIGATTGTPLPTPLCATAQPTCTTQGKTTRCK